MYGCSRSAIVPYSSTALKGQRTARQPLDVDQALSYASGMAKRDPANTAPKTNACRALDRLKIGYELRAYDFDPEQLAAERVAEKVGLPARQVFKTLCLRADDQSVLLAVIPGDCELDLKRLAKHASHRSVAPVGVKELVGLTGYIRGGVTVLACKKPYPVFADESIVTHSLISVSAGQRGLQILLNPHEYVRATKATLAPIARDKQKADA